MISKFFPSTKKTKFYNMQPRDLDKIRMKTIHFFGKRTIGCKFQNKNLSDYRSEFVQNTSQILIGCFPNQNSCETILIVISVKYLIFLP